MLNQIIPTKLLIRIFTLFLFSGLNSIYSQVLIENKPDWVVEIIPDTGTSKLTKDSFGGYYYLLADIQENISKETVYYHFTRKLFNSDGVQNMSDISVDFDPGFQSICIHEINRIRNGVKTNELINHKLKTIQRESEMERFLYDGRLTAYVNLEDIRIGDIIDYSYSIRGYNPIFKGNYFKDFSLEYNDPVREIYRRIIVPKDKRLNINYPSGIIEPKIKESKSDREYIWQNKNVKAHIYDNNVPAWFENTLRVDISSCSNWSDIVDLCLVNYQISESEQRKLKNLANELFGDKNKDSLIIPIIRFVQDNIRYLGFESGLNAYKPMLPSKVIQSRYADCKAKALLLTSLLRLYGIEAYPVLVNSNRIRSEKQVYPSPDAFNHCVVQIKYNDHFVNIDPTLSNQGGGIENYYFPNYGYGLVLKNGNTYLNLLTSSCHSETKVNNYFKMVSIGDSVSYKVITEYSGYYADDTRASFQNNRDDEITQDYLKFYSKTYPLIRSVGALKYNDNRDKNIFTVEENYIIDSLWLPVDGEPQKLELNIAALVLNSAVTITSSPERTMPYLITFPSNFTEDTYIDLPKLFTITPNNVEIKDSVFTFSYNSDYNDKIIHLTYKYSTLRDYIEGKKFKEFYSKHEKIKDNLNYSLTYTSSTSTIFKFSWWIAICNVIILIISILFSIKIYFNYNLPVNITENKEIGGWLVLIAIGLIISTFRVAINLYFQTGFFNQNTWTALLTPKQPNIPLLILVFFEFMYNSILLVYLILIQVLFYKRRNILPRLVIIFYAVNTIFLILDTILAYTFSPTSYSTEHRNKTYIQIGQSLIVSVIWILYFLYSKRVGSTFTIVNKDRHNSVLSFFSIRKIE